MLDAWRWTNIFFRNYQHSRRATISFAPRRKPVTKLTTAWLTAPFVIMNEGLHATHFYKWGRVDWRKNLNSEFDSFFGIQTVACNQCCYIPNQENVWYTIISVPYILWPQCFKTKVLFHPCFGILPSWIKYKKSQLIICPPVWGCLLCTSISWTDEEHLELLLSDGVFHTST
jgi:hypothetical protein